MPRAGRAFLIVPALVAALLPVAAHAKRYAIACTGTVDIDERAIDPTGAPPNIGTLKADQIFVIDEDTRRVAHVLTGPPAKLEDMCVSRDAACYSTFSDAVIVADTGSSR